MIMHTFLLSVTAIGFAIGLFVMWLIHDIDAMKTGAIILSVLGGVLSAVAEVFRLISNPAYDDAIEQLGEDDIVILYIVTKIIIATAIVLPIVILIIDKIRMNIASKEVAAILGASAISSSAPSSTASAGTGAATAPCHSSSIGTSSSTGAVVTAARKKAKASKSTNKGFTGNLDRDIIQTIDVNDKFQLLMLEGGEYTVKDKESGKISKKFSDANDAMAFIDNIDEVRFIVTPATA